jgi:hypothetical protein
MDGSGSPGSGSGCGIGNTVPGSKNHEFRRNVFPSFSEMLFLSLGFYKVLFNFLKFLKKFYVYIYYHFEVTDTLLVFIR